MGALQLAAALLRQVLQSRAALAAEDLALRHQIVEAFPFDPVPRHLLRDRDAIYGSHFANRIRGMGIEEVLHALRSP